MKRVSRKKGDDKTRVDSTEIQTRNKAVRTCPDRFDTKRPSLEPKTGPVVQSRQYGEPWTGPWTSPERFRFGPQFRTEPWHH